MHTPKIEYLETPRRQKRLPSAVVGQVRVWFDSGHTIRASNKASSEPLMRIGSIVRAPAIAHQPPTLFLVWPNPWPTAHAQHINDRAILKDWIALHQFYRWAHGLTPR